MLIVCASTDKAERLIAEAAGNGSQLVLFPEAFVGGYPLAATGGTVNRTRTPQDREKFGKYHSSAIEVPGKVHFIWKSRRKVSSAMADDTEASLCVLTISYSRIMLALI